MSVKFDSVDDLITCGTSDNLLLFNSALTVSFWAYVRGAGGAGNGRFFVKGAACPNFYTPGSGALEFDVSGGTPLQRGCAASTFTLNVWHHFVVTWDGSTTAANVHFYIDNVEPSYSVTNNGASPTDNTGGQICIGNITSGARSIDANMAEFAVWNSVLSSGNRATLYNSGSLRGSAGLPLTVASANLKAYWPLNDFADGSTANSRTYVDKSGNGNTGTGNWGANASGLISSVEQGFLSGASGVWGF